MYDATLYPRVPLQLWRRLLWCVIISLATFLFLMTPNPLLAQSNRPPTVTPVDDQEMYVNDTIQINVRATDDPQDTVTFVVDENLLSLPNGAELFTNGNGSAFIIFSPTAAGTYSFAVVAVDDGDPQGRTALFFTVTVKELPASFADLALESITIQSTAEDDKVHVGALFDLVIDVKNQSDATLPAADSVLQMTFDATKLSLFLLDDACEVTSPVLKTIEITCRFGTIPLGATRTVRLSFAPTTEGFANNQFAAETTTLDPIIENHRENYAIDIEPPLIDLAVLQKISSSGNQVGDQVIFEVTVRNLSAVTGYFTLKDTLTEGFKIISIEGISATQCSHFEQEVNCDDKVEPLSDVVYLITVQIVEQGVQEATAVVAGVEADPDRTNNQSRVELTALLEADIQVAIALPEEVIEVEVGDEVYVSVNVTVISTTNSIAVEEVVVTTTIPTGFSVIQVNSNAEVLCDTDGKSIRCIGINLKAGDSFVVPILLFAETPGVHDVRASVNGRDITDPTPGNNDAIQPLIVSEATSHWILVHTYDDRNGNGLQDPGEPSLPDVNVDTSARNELEQRQQQGRTNDVGLLDIPILETPHELNLLVKITMTEGISPVVSIKLIDVPPTGQAEITGANSCEMKVTETDGNRFDLPCTAEGTLAWTDQVRASVADFTAKLFTPPLQAATTRQGDLPTAEVSFTITTQRNHALYLPFVAK